MIRVSKENLKMTVYMNRHIHDQKCPRCGRMGLYLASVKGVRFFTSLYCIYCRMFGHFKENDESWNFSCDLCYSPRAQYRSSLKIEAEWMLIFFLDVCAQCKELVCGLPLKFTFFQKNAMRLQCDYPLTRPNEMLIFNDMFTDMCISRQILRLSPTLIDFDVKIGGGKLTGLLLTDSKETYCSLCGEYGAHRVKSILDRKFICDDCYALVKRYCRRWREESKTERASG